jgi:N6-L-threonylcarbamoyladenine synthase
MGSLILGIESSCDDTAAAVVEDGRWIRSSVVESQALAHAAFGGVVPELASRAHLTEMLPVIDRALSQAGIGLKDLAGIAVTNRPGLIGSLLVGVSAAKGLALGTGLPLIGVHHIHAHVYAATMEQGHAEFPSIALVVSGGHTALYLAHSHTQLELLAKTLDDAVGEAFDKVASLLGLPYPGGPSIARLALEGRRNAYAYPRYRAKGERPSFSFSGLKTAVLYSLRGGDASRPTPRPADIPDRADVAASFEEAAVDALLRPTLEAAERRGIGRVLVAGGVAANRRLREKLGAAGAAAGLEVHFPAPAYCTDNAAMIAGLGHVLLASGQRSGLGLEASPRG